MHSFLPLDLLDLTRMKAVLALKLGDELENSVAIGNAKASSRTPAIISNRSRVWIGVDALMGLKTSISLCLLIRDIAGRRSLIMIWGLLHHKHILLVILIIGLLYLPISIGLILSDGI